MRIYPVFIVFLAYYYRVTSETICASDLCVCKFIDVNVKVVCPFSQRALESNLLLPDKTVILDLSKSNLTELKLSELMISHTVEELLLNNNNLSGIHTNSFQLPELKRLDLSNNHLRIIKNEVFFEIIKLEYLNLANNKLIEISQFSFHPLVNLKEIILDNNNVGADIQNTSLFDRNGCGLTLDIQSISLSAINLGNLKGNYFLSARSIRNITVSKNNLTEIFELPATIHYLDISENPIKLLKFNYWTGPLLGVVKANNLEIEEIQKNEFMAPLGELQLEGNKHLTNFSPFAFSAQLLRDDYDFLIKNLSMRHSNISTLDKKLWILFKKIERLDLQDNPWTCDCRILWFLNLPIPHYLTENLRCASPPHLNNTRIFDLKPKDLMCLEITPNESYRKGAPTEFILSSLLIIVILIFYYVFIHRRYMINKKNTLKHRVYVLRDPFIIL